MQSIYAKAFAAELMVIHVIDSTPFDTYKEWVVVEDIDQVVARAKENAEKRLDEVKSLCLGLTKEVKTFCRSGSPAHEIVALAAEAAADLIVMGTHVTNRCGASGNGKRCKERPEDRSSAGIVCGGFAPLRMHRGGEAMRL